MSKERTRILIVDDEEIVRESLSAWLEKDGYTLATVPGRRDGDRPHPQGAVVHPARGPEDAGHRRPPGARGGQACPAGVGRRHHDRLRHGGHRRGRDEDRRLRLPGQAVRSRRAEPDDPEDRHAAGAGARERPAAQGAEARVPLPRPDQQEPRDAGGVRPRPDGRAQQLDHPDSRRERHRQGAAGPRGPRREPAQRRALRGRVLRGADRDAARVRAVRPREGRVHRRRDAPQGQVRDGRGRHAVPRRDRRHLVEAAARPPARARGPPLLPRGRDPSRSTWTSGSSRPPTATSRRPWPTARSARTCSTGST